MLDEKAAGGGAGAGGGDGSGGDGKGAGDGGAAAAAAAAAAAGGGQPGGGGGAPSPYRPEGLPAHLAGASDKDTIDHLYKAFNGFRTQQGAAGTVPEKPDGYKFEAGDKLAPYTANFAKDPVWGKTLEFAHKAGLTDKAFNAFMGPLLENLVEGGLVAAPVDAKKMLRELAPAGATYADDAAKEAAGGKRVTDNIAWADGAKANKSIDADIAGFLAASAADNPAANKLIEWLRGTNGEALPAMGGAGGSGLSEAQLKERINDDRNNPSSSKFDKAFAKETDELSKKHWG